MNESVNSGVSIREFARQVGRAPSWILKMTQQGKLPRNEDGTIPIEAGFAAYDKHTRAVEETRAKAKKKKAVEPLPDDDDAPMPAPSSKAMNVTEAFNKARLAEKTYQAKLKEIEYKIKCGDLIEREKVLDDAHKTGALLRDRLMSIAVRISGLCEGRTARDIEEIIEDAVNDALRSLQSSEYFNE